MIPIFCAQRSQAWRAARLGIPTASSFCRIITSTGGLSRQADTYMNILLGEWMTGHAEPTYQSYWMARGTELEEEALAYYELKTGRSSARVGFVYRDARRLVGGSPDAIFADGTGAEIKCPSPGVHMRYLRDGVLPAEHRAQVQGLMWLTGARHWDWSSYHPEMPDLIIRIARDEEYIAAINTHLNSFVEVMLRERERLIYVPPTLKQRRALRLVTRQSEMRVRYGSLGAVPKRQSQMAL